MNIDWDKFLDRLAEYPAEAHKLLPSCPQERIAEVQRQLGQMPVGIENMLKRFNGAKLFIKSGPLVSLFGITTVPPPSPMLWSPEWHIDRYIPKWRSAGHSDDEWPIAMMNYGVLIVMDSRGITKEWDTSQRDWGERELDLHERMEDLLREGDVYLSES